MAAWRDPAAWEGFTEVSGARMPGAAMGAALVGNFSNGNVQGSVSDQSAVNGSGGAEFSGGGLKFVSGKSAPTLKQVSGNAESSSAARPRSASSNARWRVS